MNGDRFSRNGRDAFSYIGGGELGGKAAGLARMQDVLARRFPDNRFGPFHVDIPRMVVLRTGLFDEFLAHNRLDEVDWERMSDEEIALVFQRADLPTTVVGDLMSLANKMRQPLAVRSSSLLEDAAGKPFAGVYATKMTPNLWFDAETRFHKLVEAIKFVYASMFFAAARQYAKAVGLGRDSMAVILQDIAGERLDTLWYPHLSGVARSYNFYPVSGARPEDGVVNLALGLGKTIVDGGRCWTYSPASPKAPPPAAGPVDLLKNTQTSFWAVTMGKPPIYDPIRETEYLSRQPLKRAEDDNVLRFVCSTYDSQSDRLYTGQFGRGPRLVDFSPLLKANMLPLNDIIVELLRTCEEEYGEKVEIEFAATLGEHPRMSFLQVRPMLVFTQFVSVDPAEYEGDVLFASDCVMGNGARDDLRDIVYVKPETFEAAHTREIAAEVAAFNESLTGVPYLLIGFGRWGSSDPWLGIPVNWSQIAGAGAIVEATLPSMRPDLSQGSHFFHNISSLGVPYFAVKEGLDWDWLQSLPVVREGERVRHVRAPQPLKLRVDGRSSRGLAVRP